MAETKKIYRDLAVGDTFYVWGDQFINYDYPKWCKCIKETHDRAREVDGIWFLIRPSSEVSTKEEGI